MKMDADSDSDSDSDSDVLLPPRRLRLRLRQADRLNLSNVFFDEVISLPQSFFSSGTRAQGYSDSVMRSLLFTLLLAAVSKCTGFSSPALGKMIANVLLEA